MMSSVCSVFIIVRPFDILGMILSHLSTALNAVASSNRSNALS